MKKPLLFVAGALLCVSNLFAQVPVLSYTTPQVFTTGTAITALSPTNSGGAVPATTYGTVSTLVSTGMNNPRAITYDGAGNYYTADFGSNKIYKITAAGVVTVLAGSGTAAVTNGTGTSAAFNGPSGIVYVAGNLYVTDYNGSTIRKIVASTGVVTTIAGLAGTTGTTNANPGTNARFNQPYGITSDGTNLYVTEFGNNDVRKIVISTTATTLLAGSTTGVAGEVNGTTTAARFTQPSGIVYDGTSLYVADYTGNTIRKVTTAGVVTTIVSTGLSFPNGITTDKAGNLVIADAGSHTLKTCPVTGASLTTLAGNGTQAELDGVGTTAQFNTPFSLGNDAAGTILIGDNIAGSSTIRKLLLTGYTINSTLPAGLSFTSTTGVISGTPTAESTGTYTVTGFNASGNASTNITITTATVPSISYSPSTYTLSIGNAASIAAPTNAGGSIPATVYGTVSLYAGLANGASGTTNSTTLTSARFNGPSGLTILSDGSMYLADKTNNRIRKIVSTGVTTFSGSTAGRTNSTGTTTQYTTPTDITSDGAGNLYVADFGNNQIRKLVISTTATTLLAGIAAGTAGSANGTGTAASFRGPTGIIYDAVSSALYVTDYTGNQIRKVTLGGVVTLFAGSTSNTAGSANGTGSGATFSGPSGITVDAAGNFYIADKTNNRIRKITQAGVVTTFAGSGTASSVDGTGTAATFNGPSGISIDGSGNLYVSEATGNKIRMITPAGVVVTVAGSGTGGRTNGVGTAATFNSPNGLKTDPTTGNLMLADAANNEIRKIITTGYTISPALPTGLSLNSSTGVISGTPTTVTAATAYTVTAFNIVGSSSTQITISTELFEPNISYTTPVSFLVNSAITTQSPTNVGGPVSSTIYTGAALTGATLSGPSGMTRDAAGNIYVCNYSNNTISKYSSTGTYIGLFGNNGTAMSQPSGIVFDSGGNAYVLNNNSGVAKVYKYNSSGTQTSATLITGLQTCYGIAIDASDNLYITNYSGTTASTYKIYKYSTAGTLISTLITTNIGQPTAVAVDASGNIYVTNLVADNVTKFNSAGVYQSIFAASLLNPYAVCVGPNGNIYVGDSGNNLIKEYNSAGTLITSFSYTDGEGLTVDSQNNIFTASYGNNTVYKYARTGGYFVNKPLPAGLAISNTTGNITGTPTASSQATDYTITAYNSAGSGSTIINITCYQIYQWKGTTNDVTLASNWTPATTPSAADQVMIGGNTQAIGVNMVIPTGATLNVGSIVMGTKGGKAPGITVNGTGVINVTGDITYQSGNTGTQTTSYTSFIDGTGTINATNLNITNATGTSTAAYTETLQPSVTNLNLSGNVVVTSTRTTGIQNALFTVTGGTTTVAGNLKTTNGTGNTSTISVTGGTLSLGGLVQTASTGTTAITINAAGTLKFANADPLSGLSATGTNTFTLNTGSTIEYSGADQTVYSDSTLTGLPSGLSYKNIAFSGTGIKNVTSGNLNIAGDFTNSLTSNGTTTYVDLSSPVVNFNGTTQSLAGGGGTGSTFYVVNFSGAGTKTLASGKFNMDSGGILTMAGSSTSTILDAGAGLLTLNSDATGSATVAAITPSGPSITGTVKVQRYVTGNNDLSYRGYRLFSSPVADASSPLYANYNLSYLLGSGTYLTGASGGGFDLTGNPTIYLYREDMTPSNASFNAGNYRAITKINNSPAYTLGTIDGDKNMPVGNGILFFYRGNNGTSTGTPPASLTLSSTGRLNQGQIVVKPWFSTASSAPYYLSFTDATAPDPRADIKGFNLVGNPYPSSIDWNTAYAGTASTGIYAPNTDQTMYIWNATSKNYDTYINTSSNTGIGTNNISSIIPQGQGFFVRAQNANAQLIFNESAKVNDQPDVLLLKTKVPFNGQRIRVQLVKDAINKDETVLQFNSAAQENYKPAEDALYLKGSGAVSLSNRSADNKPLAINQLPFTTGTQTIRLNVAVTASGNYTMKITEATNLPSVYDVWLIDNYKKDSLDIKANNTYSFSTTSDTATVGANRFKIVIRQNAAQAVRLLSFTGVKTTKEIKLTWTAENEGNYTTYVLQRSTDGGSTYKTLDSLTSVNQGTYDDIDPYPVMGQNKYRLKQVDIFGNTTYSNILTFNFEGLVTVPVTSNNLTVYPNPVRYILGLGIKPVSNKTTTYKITVTNNMGIVVKKATINLPIWLEDVNSLMPGTYIINVTDARDNSSIGRTTFIKL